VTGQLIFVDTHAHLSDQQFASDAGAVIALSTQLGVTRIVNVAFSERLWQEAIELSGHQPGVSFTLGIHPNSAGEWSDQTRASLLNLLASQRPVAIGETGLDYYWVSEPREAQLAAFEGQLDIAREFALPVVVHMRGDVEADIRDILDPRQEVMCIFHSFDGSAELCKWIVERGWMIGVGGLMSRRSALIVRGCLKTVPLDQLLLETDSPYLSPTGWPEKRNSPESIPIIADHLSRLLDLPHADIACRTTENARRVFGLPLEIDADRQNPTTPKAGAR